MVSRGFLYTYFFRRLLARQLVRCFHTRSVRPNCFSCSLLLYVRRRFRRHGVRAGRSGQISKEGGNQRKPDLGFRRSLGSRTLGHSTSTIEIVDAVRYTAAAFSLISSENLDRGYGSAEMRPERWSRRRNAGRRQPPCPRSHSGLKALNLRGMGTESPSNLGALPRFEFNGQPLEWHDPWKPYFLQGEALS